MDLRGARTLVTGATGGLGAAIAHVCVDRGADVIVTGRQPERLTALAADSMRNRSSPISPTVMTLVASARR